MGEKGLLTVDRVRAIDLELENRTAPVGEIRRAFSFDRMPRPAFLLVESAKPGHCAGFCLFLVKNGVNPPFLAMGGPRLWVLLENPRIRVCKVRVFGSLVFLKRG